MQFSNFEIPRAEVWQGRKRLAQGFPIFLHRALEFPDPGTWVHLYQLRPLPVDSTETEIRRQSF